MAKLSAAAVLWVDSDVVDDFQYFGVEYITSLLFGLTLPFLLVWRDFGIYRRYEKLSPVLQIIYPKVYNVYISESSISYARKQRAYCGRAVSKSRVLFLSTSELQCPEAC